MRAGYIGYTHSWESFRVSERGGGRESEKERAIGEGKKERAIGEGKK